MAVVGIQPIVLTRAVLTIAEDDFTAAVGEVVFTPEVEYKWFRSFDGRTYTPLFIGARWVCMLTYAQDFATTGSLARYLITQAATTRTLTFTPQSAGPTITAEAMIVPGQIGGRAEDGVLTANATLPLFGEPTITEP